MAPRGKSVAKQWTVMVYMAGDNNLDPNGVKDLKEMKRVGSSDKVNIVVQFDRAHPRGSKRYYIRKGGSADRDVVDTIGRSDTGDPKNLIAFIKWAVGAYRAERYMLVLWNHGQGWDDTDVYAGERDRRLRVAAPASVRHALFRTSVQRVKSPATSPELLRAILLDDDAKDFLDNKEMKLVMAGARKVIGRRLDILGMDACLMSMAEVGYQIRGGAQYTVGSAETEPLEGWPYHTILSSLIKQPTMTPLVLSKTIVTKYVASFRSDQVTQSACDLGGVGAVADSVKKLASALMRALRTRAVLDEIQRVRNVVQHYDVNDNIDLVDFCLLLSKRAVGQAVVKCCQEVITSVQRGYVVASGAQGIDLKNSHGVAIYFPRDMVSPLYAELDFVRRTGWGRFVESYLAAIGRR